MNDTAYLRRLCRSLAMRTIALTRSSSVESETASTPARLKASLSVASRLSGGLAEPPAEALVVRVDVELLAGLGVLHDQRADVGQLDLAPVEQADRQDLVALGEQVQRPLPARGADEVRDHEHQRAALDRVLARLEQRRQVGERGAAAAAAGAAGR